jgi:hypothetical protein
MGATVARVVISDSSAQVYVDAQATPCSKACFDKFHLILTSPSLPRSVRILVQSLGVSRSELCAG